MDFVNPWMLAGAAAAIAPVVLHLIMRQKPRYLEFPALRFVKARQQANSRKLRLRHLLLLLLRVAAVCLLAGALARPSMKASGVSVSREAPTAAAMIFDTSARMQYRQQNQTRLEAAQEMGTWLLTQLPEDSQVAVLESSLGSAVFQVDRGSAQQRIERLETIATGQPLAELLKEAAALLKTSDLDSKEMYVFTDLARAAWTAGATASVQQQLKALEGIAVYIVDVGAESPKNFSLGNLTLGAEVLSKNVPLQITTQLSHPADGGSRTVELYLLNADGKPQKRTQETYELAGPAPQQVSLGGGALDEGVHQGYLRIVGEDGLALDDKRYFTVEVRRPWPVLLAAPSPAEEYAFFLHEALAPEHFRKNDQARFRCDVVPLEALAKQPLEQYAAVCLLDPAPLETQTWKRLHGFVNGGGGLAVFLGRNAAPADPFNQPPAQSLLPGKLAMQARDLSGNLHLTPDNFQHPVLAEFRGQAGMIPWDASPVFRYWRLEELYPETSVVSSYSDGQPALLERPIGKGRALTLTTPVSDAAGPKAWNLLLTGLESWPSLILSNEMLLYLVGSADEQLNYRTGETAILRWRQNLPGAAYLLTTPSGDRLRRNVNLDEDAVVETSTEAVGNYRIRAGGEEDGFDRGFSTNLPADASSLDRLEPDELKKLFGDTKYQVARNRDQIDRATNLARVGLELFPLLMVLMAVVTGVEHALSNLFYRDR